MKNITLNIDPEAVMNHIYALSALRALSSTAQHAPTPLLTREESPALRTVIRDMFVHWIGRVAQWVEEFDPENGDMLTVTLIRPKGVHATLLRHDIERMLAFNAMATALPRNEAAHYEAAAQATAADLSRTLAGAGHQGRITAHWL